jgi:hypothetical protein
MCCTKLSNKETDGLPLPPEPPNREANVIENPGAGSLDYRENTAYISLCRTLREKMEIYHEGHEGTQSKTLRAPL